MQDIRIRYRPTTPVVIDNLSFEVESGCKIGVCGRTGAGKSTLSLSLSRLVEIESGKILIDGIDISKINLNLLRQKVTVIPQKPVIFKGTVRFNIDPWNQAEQKELETLVVKFGLKELIGEEVSNDGCVLEVEID